MRGLYGHGASKDLTPPRACYHPGLNGGAGCGWPLSSQKPGGGAGAGGLPCCTEKGSLPQPGFGATIHTWANGLLRAPQEAILSHFVPCEEAGGSLQHLGSCHPQPQGMTARCARGEGGRALSVLGFTLALQPAPAAPRCRCLGSALCSQLCHAGEEVTVVAALAGAQPMGSPGLGEASTCCRSHACLSTL